MEHSIAMKLPFPTLLALLLAGSIQAQSAQRFDFAVDFDDDQPLASNLVDLSHEVIASHDEGNPDVSKNNLARLQIVAREYDDAAGTIRSIMEDLDTNGASRRAERWIPYLIYAEAKSLEASADLTFDDAYRRAFQEFFGKLDDLTANRVIYWFSADLARARDDLIEVLRKYADEETITLSDALDVTKRYIFLEVYQASMRISETLATEDENTRYVIEKDIVIKTAEGATLSAVVVRKRDLKESRPTALHFTIYTNLANHLQTAMQAAARGYIGVVADTRGKRLSPDAIVPYEHEVDDTYAVIDWISKQPWSNGEVGMYGGSYSGFAAWAATKRGHPALKTIVPYVAAIPGQGLPMENNVFFSANYGWAFYVSNNKYLDEETYHQPERWQTLNQSWYSSGRPYREIDQVDGTPNPLLQRWLNHPAYDEYWQAMVPYEKDFSRIDIPVLSITGYYDDGQISALHYVKEHYRYNPDATHYLLIGPYDHWGAQSSVKPGVLRDYEIDPVAQFDTQEITFQWLDYIMRSGDKPALLQDKFNYQLMGANTWRHAPSLEAMSNDTVMLYLTNTKAGEHHLLSSEKPADTQFLSQSVNFADRTTMSHGYYPAPIIRNELDIDSGLSFISEPFSQPVSINGTFSGEIKATINKRDMDFTVVLYELMPSGQIMQLSYYIGRASHAEDRSARRLLTPGERVSIPFERARMVSRQLREGSRLLVVLDVIKDSFHQINYGTGKDVSDESIDDADAPLDVKWHSDSFIRVPVWREVSDNVSICDDEGSVTPAMNMQLPETCE